MAHLFLILGVLCSLAKINGDVIVYTQDAPHLIEEEYLDIPADFGPSFPLEGLRGFLVPAKPADACTNITGPPSADNFTGKWIVLIARYNCNYDVKVRHALAAGYDCAIVHNVNSSDLETMTAKGDTKDIYIPSVFVSENAGRKLGSKFSYGKGYYVLVNGDLPFDVNTHLLLPFAVVVVLCLLVILIFMIVKCIKDRRRARRHRLPNGSLKKIPTCKFSKGDPYDTCAICLDDYQEGERLRVLPCAHAYHAKCVDPWLTQNRRVCPVCKRKVQAAGEHRRRDSDSDDTEPLLQESGATQGGTFDAQRENPFSRAARFMARLRNQTQQDTPPTEDTVETIDTNEDGTEDTAPLMQPSVMVVSERRRPRRQRRRRALSASALRPGALQPAALPPTTQPPATLPPRAGSINADSQGEIGVAALPAPAPHVDL